MLTREEAYYFLCEMRLRDARLLTTTSKTECFIKILENFTEKPDKKSDKLLLVMRILLDVLLLIHEGDAAWRNITAASLETAGEVMQELEKLDVD